MPRTCLACASPHRAEIDKAIVAGEPLRDIARRVSISKDGLARHKPHVAQSIVKAGEKREERLSDNLIEGMGRIQKKLWQILAKMEAKGDHRGEVVALREVRECMETQNKLLETAQGPRGGKFSCGDVRVVIEEVGRKLEGMPPMKLMDEVIDMEPAKPTVSSQGVTASSATPAKVQPEAVPLLEESHKTAAPVQGQNTEETRPLAQEVKWPKLYGFNLRKRRWLA